MTNELCRVQAEGAVELPESLVMRSLRCQLAGLERVDAKMLFNFEFLPV